MKFIGRIMLTFLLLKAAEAKRKSRFVQKSQNADDDGTQYNYSANLRRRLLSSTDVGKRGKFVSPLLKRECAEESREVTR